MKTRRPLKLSFETLRRLDLDAATGGAMSEPMPSRFGACPGTNKAPMHSLQASCGIVCTIGPKRPTTTRPSVGIFCA